MKREKHLESVLAIVLGLVVIYWIKKYQPLLPVIVAISLSGLLSKFLAEKIHWLWTKLSHVMGWIMSKVILSILFYLFLFPIALLSRVFAKKDTLQLKKSSAPSYYTERNHQYTAEDLENPW